MNLERLKRETEAEHWATESAMPWLAPGLTRDQYGRTLQRLYRVVWSWEQWSHENAPGGLQPIMAGRQRAQLLARDLQHFHLPANSDAIVFPAKKILAYEPEEQRFRAAFLGAMYVMEGSTLGGQYIARHVETALGLAAGEGNAYFRGHAGRTGELWRGFKKLLAELPETDSPTVIAASKAMFGFFRDGFLS